MKKKINIILFALLCGISILAQGSTLQIEGHYEFRTDEQSLDIIGLQVCFIPSKSSSVKIPRPAGDSRSPWFCFSNSDVAAQLLGFPLDAHNTVGCGVTGNAKVVVSDYRLYAGEGDGNDLANLVNVLSKSKPKVIACEK